MEQTVAERPFSNEQQIDNGQTSNNGSLGSDTHFGQDPSQRWYSRRQTGWSSSWGDNVIHDKAVCRDFIRGHCARGTSCRFRHCESDSEDGQKLYVCYDFQRGQCNRVSCKFLHPESDKSNGCGPNGKELDAVANSGKSHVCGEKMDNNSRITYFSREPRSRSPCGKFLNDMCYYGDACPHLHSEYPTHGRLGSGSTQWQHGVPTMSRNASLGEENIGNTRWMSRGHEVGEEYNDVSTRFFSRERRSRSPCRNFLRGRCHRGAYCPHLHLDTHIRPRDDCRTQQNQVFEGTSGHLSKGSVDIHSGTSEVHEEVIEGHDRSTRPFSTGFRSKSPCRNFLRGRCHHGAYCPRLHLDTYVRPRDDCKAQQNHEVATTSDNPGFGEGSAEITLKISQERDEINDVDSRRKYLPRGPRSGSPCRKFLYGRCYRGASCFYLHPGYPATYDRSGYSVDDIAGCKQNRAQPVGESMQRASDRDNMVVNSRRWSSERQRSRPLEDLGDKARPEVCLKYCRGRCTQGESCRYLHSFHEYAKSASDCIKQPHFESATPPASCGGTRQCETSMMRQERDGLCDEKTTRQYADNPEKCNIHVGQDVLAVVDHQKYDNDEDGIGRNCEYSVADHNINSKCRPFKRQRSRSGSPFTTRDEFSGRKVRREEFQNNFHRGRSRSRSPLTPKDDSGWRDLRRYESHDNFPRGRGYNVAPFRYPYSRSYRYNGPRYFMNSEPHSRVAATSVGPSSHEVNRDSNVPESQRGDDVASHDMQLDHFSSSCLKSVEDAEQPSCVDEDTGGSVGDCGELAILKGENAGGSSIVESDSTKGGENHGSPMDTALCVPNKEDNAEVIADLNQDGSDKPDGKKQALKTYKRKVTDSSTHGLPSSSAREASLHQPDKSAARVSDESDAQKVVMASHSVKEPGERKRVVKEIQNTIESAQASTKDGASVGGLSENNCMRMSQSSLKASTSSSRRKLLVLDVNGLLADIVTVSDVPRGYKPDTIVAMKAVFKRPFCDDFLDFCFERFDVGIWSSRTKKNVDRVVDFLMFNTKQRLLFCWDQGHCTETGYKTIENRDKPLVLKELKKLWEKQEADLPWDKGFYTETNTVLLDDSPYKALRNPPYTAIFPHGYKFRDVKDRSLGPGGDLRVYLERLAAADDVQKFIQENPFGQRPITNLNLSWGFYSKIAGAHLNYQVNTSCTPVEISVDNASRQEQTANNSPSKHTGAQANNQQKREADNTPAAKSTGDHAGQREGNVDKIPAIQVGCAHSNQQEKADNNPVTENFGAHANQLGGTADKTPATRVLGVHVNLKHGDVDTIPVTESVSSNANQQDGSTDNTTVAKGVGNSSQQEGDADDAYATISLEANANHRKEKVKNTPESKIVRVDTDHQVVGNANTAATTVEASGSPGDGNGDETPATS